MAEKVVLTTWYLDTMTDVNGFFKVAHGLEFQFEIVGINVAIQNENGNWHTIDVSNRLGNRFYWNESYIEGQIAASMFARCPVKILIFTRYY